MLCYIVRRVPPHFSILPESTEVASGGAVNLTCVAVGSPMPRVKWRLGAVELTPETSVPIGKNVLQLSDVRETATYTCVAASDLGNIEYDAEVRVKGTVTHSTRRIVSLRFISARRNIYISRLCYDVSDRLSVRLSVMEVHWCIIANLGFKFRSKFTAAREGIIAGKSGGIISPSCVCYRRRSGTRGKRPL